MREPHSLATGGAAAALRYRARRSRKVECEAFPSPQPPTSTRNARLPSPIRLVAHCGGAAGCLVFGHRRAQAAAPGRGTVRRNCTGNGRLGQLGDAAPERPQVFREAAVPVLGDRRSVQHLGRTRMDGTAGAGAGGHDRRGDRRHDRRAPRWRHDRRVCGTRSGRELLAFCAVAIAYARQRAERMARGDPVCVPARPARRSHSRRPTQLDARCLRRSGRRNAHQGPGSSGDSRRVTGPVLVGDARRRSVEAPASRPGIGALSVADRRRGFCWYRGSIRSSRSSSSFTSISSAS